MITKGRISDAMAVLHKTRATKEDAIAELNELQDLLSEESHTQKFTIKDFFKAKWTPKVIIFRNWSFYYTTSYRC